MCIPHVLVRKDTTYFQYDNNFFGKILITTEEKQKTELLRGIRRGLLEAVVMPQSYHRCQSSESSEAAILIIKINHTYH